MGYFPTKSLKTDIIMGSLNFIFILCSVKLAHKTRRKIRDIKNPEMNLSFCNISVMIQNFVLVSMIVYIFGWICIIGGLFY